MNDVATKETIAPPTEPGFYQYVGGNQNMIFLLRQVGVDPDELLWYAIFDNGIYEPCEWGYIEQALGVYELVKIGSEHMYHIPESPKMLQETMSLAQVRIGLYGGRNDPRSAEHRSRLQRVIDECSRKRPVGPGGKHNDLHTPECGCDR